MDQIKLQKSAKPMIEANTNDPKMLTSDPKIITNEPKMIKRVKGYIL